MNYFLRIVVLGLVGVFLLFGSLVQAKEVSGYAWSGNIGWIKLRGPNYGVNYDKFDNKFSGYAWSENIGWIKFDGEWAQVCSALSSPSTCSGSPSVEAGGWDGKIRLRGSGFGVTYQEQLNSLSGWAWGSDVVGWIKFIDATVELPFVGDINCAFSANPAFLIKPRNTTTLSWSCQEAETCSINGIGPVNPANGLTNAQVNSTTTFTLSCANAEKTFSNSLTVKVYKPAYCEIIPNGPGCE